jgi:hypothetical protein
MAGFFVVFKETSSRSSKPAWLHVQIMMQRHVPPALISRMRVQPALQQGGA